MYEYARQVHVYETDLMGIVHHSNYLRFCEEARVDWCRKHGLQLNGAEDGAHAVFSLTVFETKVKHLKPLRYADELKINLQVKAEGARIIFQYKLRANGVLVSLAESVHCKIDVNYRVKRLSSELIKLVENGKWTETWL